MENAANLPMADGPSEERRRLFEDWTGRDFGQYAGEASRRLIEARRPGPGGISLAGHLASVEAK
jgi:hypothetical protein